MIGRDRQKGDTFASGAQSWRALAGPRSSRVGSSAARKRRWIPLLKLFGVLLLLLSIAGLLYQLVKMLDRDARQAVASVAVNPVERTLFYTDGVLTDDWLQNIIGPQEGMPIMEIDIFALKAKLEKIPQVKAASVERVFPGDLSIKITERKPLLRLLTQGSDGKRRLRLVARDGLVYRGFEYSKSELKRLPYLLPYQNPDKSYLPILGVDQVAELLDLAGNMRPELLETWQVVSLQYFNGKTGLPGQVIEVRSSLVPKIVFGASKDFALQMDRLIYILDYFKKNGDPSLKRVDLSLRGAAAVQLSSGRAQFF